MPTCNLGQNMDNIGSLVADVISIALLRGSVARKKKSESWRVPVDEDLDRQVRDYAKTNGISLAALLRALARLWTNPTDPRNPPPGVADEKRRVRRTRKD